MPFPQTVGMRLMTLFFVGSAKLLVPGLVAAQEGDAGSLCLRNESEETHLFVVEAPGAERLVHDTPPGESLCVTGATPGSTGVVSVFEDIDAMEGCSRLVPVGQSEVLRRYVDFDRCFWRSNSD